MSSIRAFFFPIIAFDGRMRSDAESVILRGESFASYGTLMDIHERKVLEENLRDYSIVLEFQKNEMEKANAALEELATTDSLTGLFNRRLFQGTTRRGSPPRAPLRKPDLSDHARYR